MGIQAVNVRLNAAHMGYYAQRCLDTAQTLDYRPEARNNLRQTLEHIHQSLVSQPQTFYEAQQTCNDKS